MAVLGSTAVTSTCLETCAEWLHPSICTALPRGSGGRIVEPLSQTIPQHSALETGQSYRNSSWDSWCFKSFSVKSYFSYLPVYMKSKKIYILTMTAGFYQQNWNTLISYDYDHSSIIWPLGFLKDASLLHLKFKNNASPYPQPQSRQ